MTSKLHSLPSNFRPFPWVMAFMLTCAHAEAGEIATATAQAANAEQAPATSTTNGLQPLDDDAMASTVGMQGIMFDIALRNNVNASNTPINCTVSVPTPNPCRLGLNFVGVPTSISSAWLMFKEYYGTLFLNSIKLDVAFLPATNTSYNDSNRFKDSSGNCLVTGCNPTNYNSMWFYYPLATARAAATYNDMVTFLNIGRMAIEFNDTTTTPVTPGYMRDTTTNAVVALRLSDSGSTNGAAQARFDGNAYVYGF